MAKANASKLRPYPMQKCNDIFFKGRSTTNPYELLQSLKEGGYLITGKSEILSGEPAIKFSPVDHQVRVYRKPQKTNEPVTLGLSMRPKVSV